MHLEHPPLCPPSCQHCLAYDNHTRALCTRAPSHASKWCSIHEELQAKLLKSYKRLTLAYESFCDDDLPSALDAINGEEDLARLRGWSEAARSKWSLSRRVITARAEHHQQFYAGGDWGHTTFVESLKSENGRLERFLQALDRQAYKVTLARSQASWVLDVPATPSFVCSDGPASSAQLAKKDPAAPLTPPPSPPSRVRDLPSSRSTRSRRPARKANSSSTTSPSTPPFTNVEAENDAFFASLCSTTACPPSPNDLLSRLRRYLVPPTDLLPSIRPATWTVTIEALFRHAILRVPSLATLAFSPELKSVAAFIDLLEQRIALEEAGGTEEAEKLWKALKFAKVSPTGEEEMEAKESKQDGGLLGVGVLAEALDTVFSAHKEGQHVLLLGGKVWKNPLQKKWPREAWDLFYQFVACPGCSLIATHSLPTWATNRRLATLGHFPAWLGPNESTAERVFRLSGMVICTSNSCQAGKKVKRVEQKEVGKRGKGGKTKKTVFVEEWERAWMYIKLPANDHSLRILDHLSNLDDRFAVLARYTDTEEITHVPPIQAACGSHRCSCCDYGLWLNKVRSGFTPIERKAARWTTTSYFPRESTLSSLLNSSSPESRFHSKPFSDGYDCVILDASPFTSPTQDSWTSFADAVAGAVLQSQGCETIGESIRREKVAAVEQGEMIEGEWEGLHACAASQKTEEGSKGKKASKEVGRRKVLYVCEDSWTARRMFREE
ncbi:hypothetical protein JCM11641_000027 [Rhodosporidiobolus odoratus]